MAYTIEKKIHVNIRVNGEDLSGSYGPGDVELPQAVADHLVALGLATPTTAAKKAAKPTPAQEDSEA